ncbi:MAG: hypothetical protein K9N46_17080 [Candidatus Marinimicrobia bacterium]|nr:hypothetical protein [Candidatus Neomarinimicrobiota bacterium]MCF7830301.1 hypothetical protein [Candidatus Neomarinimicrobiota bacterium]MCF7882442.1 hypothetical protein [Candidatus Neomarinimicrobiota bacterium]
MKNPKYYLTVIGAVILGTAFSATTFSQVKSLADYLPAAEALPEWEQEYAPEFYESDNLFQYINGEAELYRDYGFQRVVTVPYIHVENPDLSFTIDIYDMGSRLNAFGIYSSHRRPDHTLGDIGEEAVISRTSVRFWQDRFFVRVQAGALEEEVAKIIKKAAAKISGNLPSGEIPAELSLLPEETRTPHSMKYLRAGFMGQAAFGEVLQAEYTFPRDTCLGFVAWFSNEEQAEKALKSWEANLRDRGTILQSLGEAPHRFIGEAPYQGKISAHRNGRYIFGAIDYQQETVSEKLVTMITNQLDTSK